LLSTKQVGEIFGFKTEARYVVALIKKGDLKAIWQENLGRWMVSPEAVDMYRQRRISKINSRAKKGRK